MKLIYILANHRSGSTLTDFCLSALEGVISGGELVRLSMGFAERKHSFGNRCQCKESLADCGHWKSIKERLSVDLQFDGESDWSSLGLYPHKPSVAYTLRVASYACNQLSLHGVPFIADPLQSYAQNTWRFYESLTKANGGRYLVDSSKTLARFLNLYRHRPEDTMVIWLTRDGRGVLNSMTKDLDIKSAQSVSKIKQCIRGIATEQQRFHGVFKRLPDSNKLHCKYEDLCANPNQFLQEVADFLGTTASPLSSLLEKPYHAIPGSEHMKITSDKLIQDDAWKSRLPEQTLDVYAEMAGPIFEKIGYAARLIDE